MLGHIPRNHWQQTCWLFLEHSQEIRVCDSLCSGAWVQGGEPGTCDFYFRWPQPGWVGASLVKVEQREVLGMEVRAKWISESWVRGHLSRWRHWLSFWFLNWGRIGRKGTDLEYMGVRQLSGWSPWGPGWTCPSPRTSPWSGFVFRMLLLLLPGCFKSCLTLCSPVDCNLPDSSVCGILQARIMEYVACPPPVNLPSPGTEPVSHVSCIGRQVLYH